MLSFQFVVLRFPDFAEETKRDTLLVWRSDSKQFYHLQLSLFVCHSHTSVLLSKEAGSMQDSAKTISVAIQYYLLWNAKEEPGNTQQCSQLSYNCRRYLWSRNLRQITCENNEWHFPFFLYHHKDILCAVHCSCKLPAVIQTDVCVCARAQCNRHNR